MNRDWDDNMDVRPEVLSGKICPYCDAPTVYVDSKEIYRGRSYGMMYLCRTCRAYVGVHKGSNQALGRLANEELRKMKNNAHEVFDQLWKGYMGKHPPRFRRNEAYDWLAKELGIPRELCHIGMFNCRMCQLTVDMVDLERHLVGI